MRTKPNFLITMVIGVAVAAFIFAYSAPTQGAGGFHSQRSGGASNINPGGNPSVPNGLNDIKAGKINNGGGNVTPQANTVTFSHPDARSVRITNKSTDDKGNTTVHIVVESAGTVTENTTRVYDAKGNVVSCQGTKC